MKASKKNVVRKRPGRPATGQDPVTAIRLSQALRAAVDEWASAQVDAPGRSEAIRRLVEIGLSKSRRLKAGSATGTQKAFRAMDDMAQDLQKIGPAGEK